MSIASAISNAQTKVANAYTAISNKGGTLPATQNLSNMPNAINSITTVNNTTLTITPTISSQSHTPSSPYTGYGSVSVNAVTASIDNNITAGNIKDGVTILGVTGTYEGNFGIPREIVGGTLSNTSASFTMPNTVTTIGNNGLIYAFYNNSTLSSIDFGNVQTINTSGLANVCMSCTNLRTISGLGELKTIGTNGLQNAFRGCTNLTTMPDLSKVTTIDSNGMQYAFYNTTSLTGTATIGVTSLTGSGAMGNTFYSTKLSNVVFPNLEIINGSSIFTYTFWSSTVYKNMVAHPFPKLKRLSGSSVFQNCFGHINCKDFVFDALEDVAVLSNSYQQFGLAFRHCSFTGGSGGIRFPSLKRAGSTSTNAYGFFTNICLDGSGTRILDFPEATDIYNANSTASRGAFTQCGATDIYLPKLTNFYTYNQNAFNNSTTITAIHFGKENQATIQAMSGYGSKFGATNATIYFDLINHITVDGVVYDRNGPNYDYDNGYFSWKNGDNVIYTRNEFTPVVGDTVYTKSDTTYTALANTITAVS